ncbi:MAG TPA: tRNA1(Val) (adenine(37)-N6)-methyltransferase [Syntrophorhabdaceae bacterium]|nr:tRNA1(Val) (adenine(37)-N6)-methyltransferase [Syntrophorhabdaceae bacterium]
MINIKPELSLTENFDKDLTLEILCNEKIKIFQRKKGYRFSIDAIILANFVRLKRHEKVLDIGTGCGIIPIYMTKVMGYKNKFIGIEIQKELYELALKNKELNSCENIEFIHDDIKAYVNNFKNITFDAIISNPPYTKEQTGRKCPGQSRLIARHETLLPLESLLNGASKMLKQKGRLYLIYPVKRLGELIWRAQSEKLEAKRIRFVHPRKDKQANLFLVEFVKRGGIELIVEKPLYIYENFYYTEEIQHYYA